MWYLWGHRAGTHLCAVGGFMTLSGCYFFGLHQSWGFVCGTRQNATFADVAAYGGGLARFWASNVCTYWGQRPSNGPAMTRCMQFYARSVGERVYCPRSAKLDLIAVRYEGTYLRVCSTTSVGCYRTLSA